MAVSLLRYGNHFIGVGNAQILTSVLYATDLVVFICMNYTVLKKQVT